MSIRLTSRFLAVAVASTSLVFAVACSTNSSETAPAPATAPRVAAQQQVNIVRTADAAGQFKTLIAAAKAAGLADTLSNDGPFTVFAPTDAAFAKLPAGTVEALLADPETLKGILLYHVVSGRAAASDVISKPAHTTLQGSSVSVTQSGGKVMIGNATVVAADVSASNGIIHVIDTVLLPPSN